MHEKLLNLTFEDFEKYLNDIFSITFTKDHVWMARLQKVEKGIAQVINNRLPFSLILIVDEKNNYFPQGIYLLDHHFLGKMELFMVPLGQSQEGFQYEIVFS